MFGYWQFQHDHSIRASSCFVNSCSVLKDWIDSSKISMYIRVIFGLFFVDRINVASLDFCSCYDTAFYQASNGFCHSGLRYTKDQTHLTERDLGPFRHANQHPPSRRQQTQSPLRRVLDHSALTQGLQDVLDQLFRSRVVHHGSRYDRFQRFAQNMISLVAGTFQLGIL